MIIENINNNVSRKYETPQQHTFTSTIRNEPSTSTTDSNIDNNNNPQKLENNNTKTQSNNNSSGSSKHAVINLSSSSNSNSSNITATAATTMIDNNNIVIKQQSTKTTTYWCWLLKEYIRLGHAKSMNRVIHIIDQLDPYLFNNILNDNIITDKFINDKYVYSFNNKEIVDTRRSSFPFVYIPNLLRQRSDLFQYFNRNFSFSNILYALSTANIENLIQPNFLPVSKSLPIVPFLLSIVYLKLCVSKGEGLRAIVDALINCQSKSNQLPQYEYPAIPVNKFLELILLGHIRFIDWDPNTMELIKTEVYFNELFETLYLTGREYLLLPNTQQKSNNNNNNNSNINNSITSVQKQQQQTQQQQQTTKPTGTITAANSQISSSVSSKIPYLTVPNEDYYFKTIDIYLSESRKIVFYNIRSLVTRKSKPTIWTQENLAVLFDCTLFHIDLYVNTKESCTNSQLQEIMIVLESCIRLSLNWITDWFIKLYIFTYIPTINTTPTNITSTNTITTAKSLEIDNASTAGLWWHKEPEQFKLCIKLWIGIMDRVFSEIIKDPNAEKLLLIGLIWLGISVGIDDDAYPLFIGYINKYPDNLNDITKSTLIIKALGYALVGVETVEQTTELIGIMSALWDNPRHQPNTPPTLEHGFLIHKTIHFVFNTKFKQPSTHQMESEIIDWTKVICDETNNIFYQTNQNSKYTSLFIGSAIMVLVQSNKCKFIPVELRKHMISQIQEIFYTSINQANHLSKHQKIGLATSYCMSKIEPLSDKDACHNILKIILDVLLEEILGINGCLNEWLEKPSEINNLIIKKIESHRTAPIFTVLPSFVTSITTLILFLNDNEINKTTLLKLCDYAYNLNDLWYNFIKESNLSFPRASIQRTLTPTLTGIVRCFSFLFTDIAKSLTPIDSVMGIEIFSQIGFITDDDIPIVNLAIKALVLNISKSECAVTRVVDRMPVYMTVSKEDNIACSKVITYLQALENLVTKVPHNIIINHIVPNLFEYMEYPNEKLNKLSHIIIGKIFTIPDLHLTVKMVPKYLSIALKTFPTYTKITSLFTVLVSIIENNSPTNPIVLYAIKTITDQVKNMMPQDKQKTSLKGSLNSLVHLLFSTLQFVDAQILELVLEDIKEVIDKAPNFKIKSELCSLLLSEITGNLENSKKNLCISWYLNLIKNINVVVPTMNLNNNNINNNNNNNSSIEHL